MLERFEKFFEETDGCWEWTGAAHERGYGYFYTPKEYSKRKMDYAHRVSLFLYRGERDDSLCVLHTCDNPKCVNPDHLVYGTHSDNMEDMARKGRAPRSRQKLSEEDLEFALLARSEGAMVKDIAKVVGLSSSHMSRVLRKEG